MSALNLFNILVIYDFSVVIFLITAYYSRKSSNSILKMVERYSHLTSAYSSKMINRLNGKFKICHLFATWT